MKKWITLCLLLAVLAGLSGCTLRQQAASQPIELWYVRGDPFADIMEELAEDYNATNPSVPVHTKGFDSRSELGRSLDSARPELLLCDQRRAFTLYDQGKLKALDFRGAPPQYAPLFEGLSGCIGSSYFPLGAEVPVLAIAPTVGKGLQTASLEMLLMSVSDLAEQTGSAQFGTDSFATLFANAMAQTDTAFAAVREEDVKEQNFVQLYNLLANCAYQGALWLKAGDVLPMLQSGQLSCAICMSTSLRDVTDLQLEPVPVFGDGERLCLGQCQGLAVTAAFDIGLRGAAEFVTWLSSSTAAVETSLKAGLLPAAATSGEELDVPLRQMVTKLEGYHLYLPERNSGYLLNGTAFDTKLRSLLALLT